MKLSYKWLNEYVPLDGITPEELAEKMTTAGLEVEGIHPVAQGTGLVIGEVMECVPHPDSDHLHVTQTKVADGKILQIVCGAPNCRKGLKVIAALPGAKLPGGGINAKPVRGQESNGMLCALYELGVDAHWLTEAQMAGIEELPSDAPIGETEVFKYLGLDDTVLDVSLTPNRADCASMWNMAKEVAAILHRKATWPDYEGKADIGTDTAFHVASSTDKCPVFYGKAVNHVSIAPSPKWMQNYLHAAGVKAINNVVDISNFVMLETGQPLHYYDLNKLSHQDITVVDDQELTMTALDGIEYKIEKGDILITTNGIPTGAAGIMGGEESMIDENTKAIFIESALFSQVQIRRTSIRLNLITEAAQRFTKGLEPLSQKKAMDRSVQLLEKYADASGFEKTVVVGDPHYEPKTVVETLSHCNDLLGTSFDMDCVKQVFAELDFKPEIKGDSIICHIPSYRTDIDRPADLDEEVIRLIGYDGLKSTLPWMEPTVGKLTNEQVFRRMTRNLLTGMNLHEIITYTLVSRDYIDHGCMPLDNPIPLAMPMSEARGYIRTSLLNSVLECVQYNEAHQNADSGYFEISHVYGKDAQEERLAIALDGRLQQDRLHKVEIEGDFYALKGILSAWLFRCGYQPARIQYRENHTDTEHFHPYRSAEIWLDKTMLGIFGEIHPAYAKKFDLKHTVYAEIKLDPVINGHTSKVRYEALDKYPSVSRDLSLVTDADTTASAILDTIRKAGGRLIRSLEIFDVYQGEHVAEGKKSVALRIVYQSSDHTLKEEEITPVHQKILASLSKNLSAELRSE